MATTNRILEALDDAGSGRLRLDDLACPPYREAALVETAEAFEGVCRVARAGAPRALSIEIEVLPGQEGEHRRQVVLGLLNHLLDLSIREHFRCP